MSRYSRQTEREHLHEWEELESGYVEDKFFTDDKIETAHDDTLRRYDLNEFWLNQVTQYYGRAQTFLSAIKSNPDISEKDKRDLERRAQQALAKAYMTARDLVASSIRVYGALPAPGVPSGEISQWVCVNMSAERRECTDDAPCWKHEMI